MQSKNKPAQTAAERRHVAEVAALEGCVVCDTYCLHDGHVHEPEQGLWFVSMKLCPPCHTGADGWHGTRKRWTLRRMTELKAIDKTHRLLAARRHP